MRELKFRRWNSKRDRFEYFGLSGFFNDADLTEISTSEEVMAEIYDICSCADGPFEQYAGVKDSIGNWIWEGDILSRAGFGGRGTYVVVYHQGECAFMLSYLGKIGSPLTKSDLKDNYKKIGNIHENQDLLDD